MDQNVLEGEDCDILLKAKMKALRIYLENKDGEGEDEDSNNSESK